MKIRKYYNTNYDEFKLKQENIFIAFCLGNKFFNDENNIRSYIKWAAENTKEKVLLIIVDKIQITNYRVRNNNSEKGQLNRIMRDSKKLEKIILKIIDEFSKFEQEKITLIEWEDYELHDFNYYKITHLVYKLFKNSIEFRDEVLKAVKESITDRKFNEEQYYYLCDYVLDEFALCYSGIEYEGVYYNTYVYPYSDSVLELFVKLQNNIILPKICKKLPEKKTKVIIMN
jgi:tRNA-dependent cyclodipeptide synthase